MTMRVLHPVSPEDYLDWFNLESRPLLELARKNASPAYGPKIEWQAPAPNAFMVGAPRFVPKLLTNYTQILRQPFQRKWLEDEHRRETFVEAEKKAGEKILDDAERTLWYGKPNMTTGTFVLTTCGGVLHYLGRRVYENDVVRLRELTPLRLYTSRGERDQFIEKELHTHEWIWEFSLEVIRGRYERGMSPVCLPPNPKPVKPWAQGACLDEKELVTV